MHAGDHTSEAKSWSKTPPCAVEGRQNKVAVFAVKGREGRETTSYRGNRSQVGSLVTRETSRGECPSPALIRTLAGAWSKYKGRSVM